MERACGCGRRGGNVGAGAIEMRRRGRREERGTGTVRSQRSARRSRTVLKAGRASEGTLSGPAQP